MLEAIKPLPKRNFFWQWGLVVALAVIVAIGALPGYLNGQWPWSSPLQASQIKQVRTLRQTALELPGWNLSLQQEVSISGNPWGLAEYQAGATASTGSQIPGFALLLRPQPWHNDQPQVEWVDIAGVQGWDMDDLHHLRFTVPVDNGEPLTVTARYFRGVQQDGTFAVLQWYAWPTGGHPAPGRWFWADQARQWQQRERMAWVAVTALIPIEPVGDIRPYSATAISIGQVVQSSLVADIFS